MTTTARQPAAEALATQPEVKIYATRLHLDPTRLIVQEALANPWRMHRLISTGEGCGISADGRTLYRVESNPGKPPSVLVQMPGARIKWDRLLGSRCVTTKQDTHWTPTNVAPGTVLNFMTVAVPVASNRAPVQDLAAEVEKIKAKTGATVCLEGVVSIWRRIGKNGVVDGWTVRHADGRHDKYGKRSSFKVAVPEGGVGQWLQRVMRGVRLLDWRDDGGYRVQATKYETGNDVGLKIGWEARRISGVLQVECVQEFTKTMTSGIGSSRAFGFGLVSVAGRMR